MARASSNLVTRNLNEQTDWGVLSAAGALFYLLDNPPQPVDLLSNLINDLAMFTRSAREKIEAAQGKVEEL